jgi:dTDP-4-amino-4,6-dideoxygalactose transaminase
MDEVEDRLSAVARSGQYIFGPEVEAFEREFAEYLGVRHAVGVANGTDALTIALRALGIGRGDEVICPSLTFYATPEAVVNAGAGPVFCDVDADTFCVTAETVKPKLSERTKAILPVHLFGNPAPVPELERFGVPVVEDAAQAAGAALDGRKVGALGHVATFSFFPSKNLPCLGDGGAVATDSDEVAERARILRFHGSLDKETHTDVGFNSRLDAMQSAVLRLLLPELDGWTDRRRAAAAAYQRAGLDRHVRPPVATDGADPAYHLYVVKATEADALANALGARGIQARGYYRIPCHRQPAMAAYADSELPVTDEVAARNLALPMGTNLTAEQVAAVVDACGERVAA